MCWHQAFGPQTWSNWAVVIVAVITALVIGWQAKKTAEATQVMRDSIPHQEKAAEAASLNAKAAMGVAVPTLRVVEFWFGVNPDDLATFQRPNSRVVVKNYGSTPAFLQAAHMEYVLDRTIISEGHAVVLMGDPIVLDPGETFSLENRVNIWPHLSVTNEVAKTISDDRGDFEVRGFFLYDSVFELPLRRLNYSAAQVGPIQPGGINETGTWLIAGKNEYIKRPNEQKAN